MPIYAYKCQSCGYAKDVLQKLSDVPLKDCPTCGAATFAKQLTAAGFQLKGSGWYVTDFKGGGAAPSAKPEGHSDAAPSGDAANKSDAPKADAPKADGAASTPASAPAPAVAASPTPASKP